MATGEFQSPETENFGSLLDFASFRVFRGRYSIEATTNLAPAAPAWEPLVTLTNTFGSVQFNDPFPTNRWQRFYRAIGP